MKSFNFELLSTDSTKTLSGVYIETKESTQIIFSQSVCGTQHHTLKAKKVTKPLALIASYVAGLDLDAVYNAVKETATGETQEIKRITKVPKFKTEYKVPNTKVYVPSGTVLTAVVGEDTISFKIEDISSTKREIPVDNKYTKNDELNKYIAMFGIPYDVFKKHNLAVSFNYFLGKLRSGKVDSIAVPKSTIYVPTSSFYKHNMYKSDSPITQKNSYIRRSSRFDVYEIKKDS